MVNSYSVVALFSCVKLETDEPDSLCVQTNVDIISRSAVQKVVKLLNLMTDKVRLDNWESNAIPQNNVAVHSLIQSFRDQPDSSTSERVVADFLEQSWTRLYAHLRGMPNQRTSALSGNSLYGNAKAISKLTSQGNRKFVLHEILGNPFQPITFDPAWRTPTAKGIAEKMYDANDFAGMPVLADALEDAGCDVPQILVHCREVRNHIRGCFVVEGVLNSVQ